MKSKLELVSARPGTLPPKAAAAASRFPWAVAVVMVALAAGASFLMHQRMGAFLSSLDGRALDNAAQTFSASVDLLRKSALSEVTVLAEDTRVRATVMTPTFDEATVRDVLEDLKKTSGATLLAVLDTSGKVRAVTGGQLRDVDLGGSPVVKAAMQGPGADVWTFGEQVLVVGVAPVRAGQDAVALFMMGFEVGETLLQRIDQSLGVSSAVLVRDRLVAKSTNDAAANEALRAASGMEGDGTRRVGPFVARVTRTSSAATAGKLVWVVGHQHQGDLPLRALMWTPLLLVGLGFVAVGVAGRRT
jgi:hypothetical protein